MTSVDQSEASVGSVQWRCEQGLAYVTLSHPDRLNAITVMMWRQLQSAFETLSKDDSIRCVIIKGEGENFAAGADIREFPTVRADLSLVRHYHQDILAPALTAIADCPHPVIAQIEGVCVGGGLEIACQADIRIAGESSRFGVPINQLGFPMAPDEMRGLLALIGRPATLEILLEGRIFDAQEARVLGLLNRIVPDAHVAEQVQASAKRIMSGAPLAARINKRQSRRLLQNEPLTGLDLQDFFSYAESHDHHEGVSAFLAGRKPQFTGE
jgi:enoyl-CoA hydratase